MTIPRSATLRTTHGKNRWSVPTVECLACAECWMRCGFLAVKKKLTGDESAVWLTHTAQLHHWPSVGNSQLWPFELRIADFTSSSLAISCDSDVEATHADRRPHTDWHRQTHGDHRRRSADEIELDSSVGGGGGGRGAPRRDGGIACRPWSIEWRRRRRRQDAALRWWFGRQGNYIATAGTTICSRTSRRWWGSLAGGRFNASTWRQSA